jgi:hypothetical protein
VPVKRRMAKGRIATISLDSLTPNEFARVMDDPRPPSPTGDGPDAYSTDAEWWSLSHDLDTDVFRDGRPTLRQLWQLVGDDVVAEYAKRWPGCRPDLWWTLSAPRQPREEWPTSMLPRQEPPPEPRSRVGGVGRPAFEWTAYAFRLRYGVPVDWIWTTDSLLGADPRAADRADPPVFEAECVYLKRLGLLLPGEARRLTPEDFEPEAIAVPRDDD